MRVIAGDGCCCVVCGRDVARRRGTAWGAVNLRERRCEMNYRVRCKVGSGVRNLTGKCSEHTDVLVESPIPSTLVTIYSICRVAG